jgi:general secretion pathway protein M
MSTESEPTSFNVLRQQMLARWAAMAPRERQMAQVAAALLVLVVVVFVFIRPAWKSVQQTPAQLRDVSSQVGRMRALAEEAQALKQLPPVPPAQAEAALRAATERLGPGAKLSLQSDRATVEFNKVLGSALVDWLAEARAAARVRPLEANLTQSEPGHYSGTMVLGFAPGPGSAR